MGKTKILTILFIAVISFSHFIIAANEYDLSFEELRNLKFTTSATLTETEERKVPASTTMITREMIENSGARNLDELLEIFVPSFQKVRQNAEGERLGIRGITASDSMIILVNGRMMNEVTQLPNLTERFMSMLGDIDYIEVIRGAGSAIHGPGAIAGVINIHTFSGLNFEGTEISVRKGFVEEFTNLELKLGHRFDHKAGLFLYYGIDKYRGASGEDSPYFWSVSAPAVPIEPGQSIEEVVNDRAAFNERLRHKLHLQYDNQNFTTWVRYLSGGEQHIAPRPLIQSSNSLENADFGIGFQQLTLFTGYDYIINDAWTLDLNLSYDMTDYKQVRPMQHLGTGRETHANFREDKLYLKLVANWHPAIGHDIAFGSTFSRYNIGGRTYGFPDEQAIIPGLSPFGALPSRSWYVNTYSFFGEYQWQISPQFILFLGNRWDKHPETEWMNSPKVALVHTPDEFNTWKFIYNSSVRREVEAVLRRSELTGGDIAKEQADHFEIIYDRKFTEKLSASLSSFYSESHLRSWSSASSSNIESGLMRHGGLELSILYNDDFHMLRLSHSFVKLFDFDLADPNRMDLQLTSMPYGYGESLAFWSEHETKLYYRHKLNERWSIDASARVYWGYPGAENSAKYNQDNGNTYNNMPATEGNERAFKESIFVNLGLDWNYSEQLRLRVDALNVLGWIDKDFNKRNNYARMGTYRNEAAAVSLQLIYKF